MFISLLHKNRKLGFISVSWDNTSFHSFTVKNARNRNRSCLGDNRIKIELRGYELVLLEREKFKIKMINFS